ncbi:MAG: S-layer homology domain-containing protein [Lachnospiraceae bacterium]|nr:S-layer homology domain-containing protein [Lachnospiraceae bacterium]
MMNIFKKKVSKKVSAIVISIACIGALSAEGIMVGAADKEFEEIFAESSTEYASGGAADTTSIATGAVSEDEAAAYIRGQLMSRSQEIHVTFKADDDFKAVASRADVDAQTQAGADTLYEVLGNKVYAYSGESGTGDELRNVIDSCENKTINLEAQGDDLYAEIDMPDIQYRTTTEQDIEYSAKLNQVLPTLQLEQMTDYNKVKTIYEYITSHVTYDKAHENDESYALQYTGYGALCKGTAVCEGYASLFYRMCTMKGLDCRIIFGKADTTEGKEAHAWNLVRVDGRYYYCDATWDAGSTDDNFDWFLIGSNHFTGHEPDANSASFLSQYPISTTDDPEVQVGTATESGTTGLSEGQTTAGSFTDVKANAYYAASVDWAVSRGITSGKTATTFGTNDTCTRGQLVTFLYRLNGSPAVDGTSEFADAQSGSYKDAITWAVSQRIASGTSDTTFSPSAGINRAQAVAILWRAAGSPDVTSTAAFADVKSDAYYAKAVAWAASQGISSGTDVSHFSPNASLTRAQTVTLLNKFAGVMGMQ